ncbi:Cytochrome c oxidase assembly protein cox18, mitochondrial, partial [Chytridiales sp. JEL 0842]
TLRFVQSLPYREKVPFQERFAGQDPLALDLLEKMLVFDPKKRISVSEGLEHPYLAAYHDPSDEPVAETQFDWSFTEAELSVDEWKTRIYSFSTTWDGTLISPVSLIESYFHLIHSHLPLLTEPLPWWLSIIAGTVLLRTVITGPLALYQRERVRRFMDVQPLLRAWETTIRMQESKSSAAAQASGRFKTMMKKKAAELYKIHNCQPLYTFILPWAQLPLFVTVSFALRNMSGFPIPFLENVLEPVAGFHDGGVLWFLDLTQPDPTLVLPLVIGTLHLLNIEMNSSNVKALTASQSAIKLLFRTLAVLSIPIATQIPSALAIYWATSASFSLVQNALVRRIAKHRAAAIAKEKPMMT